MCCLSIGHLEGGICNGCLTDIRVLDVHNSDVVFAVAIAHVQVGRETEAQAVLNRFGGDNDDDPPPAAALAIA